MVVGYGENNLKCLRKFKKKLGFVNVKCNVYSKIFYCFIGILLFLLFNDFIRIPH